MLSVGLHSENAHSTNRAGIRKQVIRLYQFVGSGVGEYDGRCKLASLFGSHQGIGHDDDDVAGLYLAGGGSVEAYDARTPFALDDVGLESFAVVVVDDRDLFVGNDVCRVHQILVDRDATDVIQIGLSNGYSVNF